MEMVNPTDTAAWRKLMSMQADEGQTDTSSSIVCDDALDLTLDLQRSLISSKGWNALFDLAEETQVLGWRDRMMAGDAINMTENRAVGHMWLRGGERGEVLSELSKMQQFCDKIHQSDKYTDVVNIGIGGSDLGPRFVCDALRHLDRKLNVHFVSNVDAADIEETLQPLNPETTLFVIVSKTFTTQETMMNAALAKAWLGDLSVADHMIAVSTNAGGVQQFGIDPQNMFSFWDWVGGRFSVWSCVGISIALTYGYEVFQEFLDGTKKMDEHFMHTNIHQNMPVLLALAGVWQRNVKDRPAVAVLPYAQNLDLLPDYLQQLDMESNGKSVDRNGHKITDYQTGPIIFGQAGTNGQHSFYQWLHQGTQVIPCEFIRVEASAYDKKHHTVLNIHQESQAEALTIGQDDQSNPHRHYDGMRPSVAIVMNDLSPHAVGQLMALYEHKIFTQGILWNVNSFDQFGVELGKKLASQKAV